MIEIKRYNKYHTKDVRLYMNTARDLIPKNSHTASFLCVLKGISFCILLVFLHADFSFSSTQRVTYFQETEHELNVYKIHGVEKGKTLLIIGGIQGNEPGGYLAADLYVDMSLKKGNLIVVPRANFYSIIRNQRGVSGDMNRKFAVFSEEDNENKIVGVLKKLIAESDYLLNLHDGSGFYSETWESDLRNPKRFGQSVIADSDQYCTKGNETLYLGDLARKVCETVNAQMENKAYHFRFNNHRTDKTDTIHAEQRKSATYYALTHHGIPAFGIETSKSIPSNKLRVKFQSMVINAFMKEFDIIPEHPKIYLNPPRLEYLVVTVNKANPVVVYDKQSFFVRKGDTIEVSHIEANYERGLSVDILGLGNSNDYRKNTQIKEPTTIVVKKDKYHCGEVSILLEREAQESAVKKHSIPPLMEYLIIEANQISRVVKNRESLRLVRGDFLKITDVMTNLSDQKAVTVNFKGFVGNKVNNTGEDRGYLIDTTRELWKRYSQGGLGQQYPIVVTVNGKKIGEARVDFIEPRLDYLIVRLNESAKLCYTPQEVIKTHYNDRIEIMDVKTNVADNHRIKVNFKGFSSGDNGDDRKKPILLNDDLLKRYSVNKKGNEYEIVVSRGRIKFGKVRVYISPEKKQ